MRDVECRPLKPPGHLWAGSARPVILKQPAGGSTRCLYPSTVAGSLARPAGAPVPRKGISNHGQRWYCGGEVPVSVEGACRSLLAGELDADHSVAQSGIELWDRCTADELQAAQLTRAEIRTAARKGAARKRGTHKRAESGSRIGAALSARAICIFDATPASGTAAACGYSVLELGGNCACRERHQQRL